MPALCFPLAEGLLQTSSPLGLGTPPDRCMFIPFQQRKKLELTTGKSLSAGHTAERDSWSEHVCGGPVSALALLRPPHFSCSVVSSGRSHCKSFWDKVEHKGREGQPAGLVLAAPFLRASPPTRKGPDGRMQGEIWHPSPLVPGMLTFCLDFKSCSNQSKQGCIKHDRPITVERHVHGH